MTTGPVEGSFGRWPVPAGSVGVPVRLADPVLLPLVRPGDRVDLMPAGSRRTRAVASAALVLDVTGADDPTVGALVLALSPSAADTVLAGLAGPFAIVLRPD